jgi:hypothetical protein
MKPPPLLLGAAVLFWGWQTGFELAALVMALILEGARWIQLRWDFSDEDFTRIWTFCALLFLASGIYAFTANEGPSQFRGFFENPNLLTERNAGTATARTAAALFRWLPMVFFLFAAAQGYSAREGIPLETISLIMRKRWRRAQKAGKPAASGHTVNVSYYYFGLCLFAASVHQAEGTSFFWGLCALLGCALWWHRPRRFNPAVWVLCLAAAVGLGYVGQRGMSHLQGYLGNLNPWWLGNLGRGRHDPTQSRTDLGRVGRIKTSNRIVIRLTPQEGAPPPLLRETSYRRFNGQTWFSDLLERDYLNIPEEAPNSGSYQLLRDKTNTFSVNIGCYLEGGKALLPLPAGTARLEHLTAFTLARSPLGGVFDDGPGVVVFDAQYGPGATIDSSPDPEDRAVPSRERPAIEQVIGELNLSQPDLQPTLKALNGYFSEKFAYSVWQPSPRPSSRTNETPLTRFLLKTRSGHCEYFASAGVLLLRQLGFAARYAVGYAVHEGSGGSYVVRQRDAHAWCLVWDEKHTTWRDIDFTPPVWVQVETSAHGWLQAVKDLWSRVGFELSKFRWGQTHLRQYLLWAVLPVLVVLLYQIISHTRRKHRQARADQGRTPVAWPGLDSEFYEVEKALAQHGLARLPNEPLTRWLDRLSRADSSLKLQPALHLLLGLHYRYRFDPHGISQAEREALRTGARAFLSQAG